MRTLSVCVGSSCHLMGAYEVINELKRLLKENNLKDQVELKACFCLGKCQSGVSLSLDGTIHTSLTRENIGEFFSKYILM